ncbi:MAG: LacI family DNA-binding transcriptional regulator [Opitutaceae bacterium]
MEDGSKSSKKRVTYSDIAEALGVSKMTVSYSMRNDPRISETTRLRVQEKAIEMGYSPDPMLSALAHYRSENREKPANSVLAWINFCKHPEEQRKREVFNCYWKGAEEAARKRGYQLKEFRLQELSLQRMHSIFKARGIRGILLTPTPADEEPAAEELAAFPWESYATVRFGESLRSLNVDFISSAQVPNTILAFEEMQRKGYQRIGFVGHYQRQRLFSAGYIWAQHALPKSQQLEPLFLPNANHRERLYDDLGNWMKSQQPDAIICTAVGILETLKKLGCKIPKDIGLVSMSKQDNPIDAGIDQNSEEIGRTAIRALVSQLDENRYGFPRTPKEILVEGHWTDGSMLPRKT